MSQPFIGEIRMFGGNFAPAGWAFCNGAILPIAENDALFTLIGTTYGGDGEETFALPNLSSRLPLHQGTRPGSGITYQLGELAGTETVTLTTNQIPSHTHTPLANSGAGTSGTPANGVWAASATSMYTAAAPDVNMAAGAALAAGGSQPHENMMPFLCITFIISLFGIFPPRT
jgi:microcystin-dependent protein